MSVDVEQLVQLYLEQDGGPSPDDIDWGIGTEFQSIEQVVDALQAEGYEVAEWYSEPTLTPSEQRHRVYFRDSSVRMRATPVLRRWKEERRIADWMWETSPPGAVWIYLEATPSFEEQIDKLLEQDIGDIDMGASYRSPGATKRLFYLQGDECEHEGWEQDLDFALDEIARELLPIGTKGIQATDGPLYVPTDESLENWSCAGEGSFIIRKSLLDMLLYYVLERDSFEFKEMTRGLMYGEALPALRLLVDLVD